MHRSVHKESNSTLQKITFDQGSGSWPASPDRRYWAMGMRRGIWAVAVVRAARLGVTVECRGETGDPLIVRDRAGMLRILMPKDLYGTDGGGWILVYCLAGMRNGSSKSA
jgi:hypothetical protein